MANLFGKKNSVLVAITWVIQLLKQKMLIGLLEHLQEIVRSLNLTKQMVLLF